MKRKLIPPAKALAGIFLLMFATASWVGAAAPTSQIDVAAFKRDSARCRARVAVDACYDAIRWKPDDPELLVTLGDALERAQRPADALRNYRRAASLAPNTRGLAAKISAIEAKLSPTHAKAKPRPERAPPIEATAKRFSNAAAEGQSH
jgi:cytochrome c-type biogenesis protein CcmH/NrfG